MAIPEKKKKKIALCESVLNFKIPFTKKNKANTKYMYCDIL